MKWRKQPPDKEGYWFVTDIRHKEPDDCLVEVESCSGELKWSFLDGMSWNSVLQYPKYRWAGPIVAPSRKGLK